MRGWDDGYDDDMKNLRCFAVGFGVAVISIISHGYQGLVRLIFFVLLVHSQPQTALWSHPRLTRLR